MLDASKDRLYTLGASSPARRSAQTALFEIVTALLRLLAPVLCFTCEEAWQEIKKLPCGKDLEESIFLSDMPEGASFVTSAEVEAKWNKIREIRSSVLKALEEARQKGLIGAPLEAKIIFNSSDKQTKDFLKETLPLWPEVAIVSQVEVAEAEGKEKLEVEGLPAAEDVKRTVFYVAKNGKYLGAVYFKDRLRANAKSTISFLKAAGKKICLISGDNNGAVAAAAGMAGIEEYYSAMYPQDKAAKIAAASNMGHKTVMLGDGFNDILALLQAGAGVAFSAANNVFSSWVDIIIKDRDFAAFRKVFGFEACRANVIKQNVYISVFVSVFMFWEVLIAGKTLAWYEQLLAAFLTLLVITINSARINYGKRY